MWVDLRCWLISKKDKKRFLSEMGKQQFWGNGVQYPEFYEQWVGEYPWAPSMEEIVRACYTKDDWIRRTTVNMLQTVCGYNNERSGTSARLPGPIICELLKLRWSGNNFDYFNPSGELMAFCPVDKNSNATFKSPLLAKAEPFLSAIDRAGLTAVWAVLSERSCYSYKKQDSIVKKWMITQRLYGFEKNGLVCYGDKQYEIPHNH